MRTSGKGKGGKGKGTPGTSSTAQQTAQQTPPAKPSRSPLHVPVSPPMSMALWSPGLGSATTPQLFSQRKPWMPAIGESPTGTGPSSPAAADDSVKVVVRIRPISGRQEAGETCLRHTGPSTLALLTQPEPFCFTADHVMGPAGSQLHLYKVVGRPIVENALAGFNSCVMAYGQTGSGKTHTMLGELPNTPTEELCEGAGLIPRIFLSLFERIAELEGAKRARREVSFALSCSLLEIYKEQLTDLMAPSQRVVLREDKHGEVVVEGLSWHPVNCAGEVLRLLARGAASRHTAATRLNDTSSRSHVIMTCSIEARVVEEGAGVVCRRSKLSLVDLAGSERQKVSDTEGERLKEAQAINKSLFTLAQVINKLTEGSAHVPYRESKLTQLLRESLGGNSRTVLISTVSQATACLSETHMTLSFAHRAKQIKNNAVVNENVSQSAVEMASELQRLRQEVTMLRGLAVHSDGGSSPGREELTQALALNGQLESSNAHLKEQLGCLRQERDAFETAAKAAHTQLQILGEAGGGGDQHLQELAAELAGLAAEVQQRRLDQAAAAAELSEKAAALSAAEQELEVARSQLAALQPGRECKENRVLSSQEMAATVTSLEAAYSTVEVQMAKLMRRNDELVAERDRLHTKVQDLEGQAVTAALALSAGRQQMSALHAERSVLQEDAQRLAAELAGCEAQLLAQATAAGDESANDGSADRMQQLPAMKTEVAAMQRDLEARERSKAAAVERAALLERQLLQLTAKASEPTAAAAAAAAQVVELKRQLQEAKEASLAHKAQAAYEMRHRQQLQAEVRAQTTLDRQQLGVPPMADHQLNETAQRLPTAGERESLVAQQLEELRSQHAASEAALVQQQGVVLRLRGDVQEAASEMLLLRAQIAESHEQLAADQGERVQRERELLTAVVHKEAQLDQVTRQAQELSRRLQEEQARSHAAASEAAQLQEILDVKSDRLVALESEAGGRQERLAEQQAVLQALEDELSRVLAELGAVSSSRDSMRQRADELSDSLADSRIIVEARGASIAGLEAALRDLRSHAEGTDEQVASLQQLAAARQAEVQSLALSLEAAQGEIRVAKQQAEEWEAAVARLNTRLCVASAAAAAKDEGALQLEATIERLQAEAVAHRDAAAAGERELQAEAVGLQCSLADAQQEMAVTEAELSSVRQQLERAHHQLSDAQQGLAVRTQQLQAHEMAVAALAEQMAAAQRAVAEQEERAEGLSTELAAAKQLAKERCAAAEERLSAADNALASQASDLQEALDQVTELEAAAVVAQQLLTEGAAAAEATERCTASLEAALSKARQQAETAASGLAASEALCSELQELLATAQQDAAAKSSDQDALHQQLHAAREAADVRATELAAAQAETEETAARLRTSEQKLEQAAEAAAASAARIAALEAGMAAGEEQVDSAKSALKDAQAHTSELIRDHLSTLRAVQEEVAALKVEADKAHREKQVLRESLNQATADAVEQLAAHREFRVEREEALGVLRAQVAHIQAVGASGELELKAAATRLADLQKQLVGSKAQAAAAEQAAAAATSRLAAVESELEAAHACTAASELRVSGVLAQQHQLRGQLRQTQEEAERLAAAVQQAAADTAKGMASEQQAGAVEVADKAASSQTPPPSLDAACIRDLREALRAQHEATVSDLKQAAGQEQAALGRKLQGLQRELDAALADCSLAREAARVSAASQEQALAAACAAQGQLLVERNSVMSSLSELQAAFVAAEAKRGAELKRLKQLVGTKQREAEALRAQLYQLTLQQAPAAHPAHRATAHTHLPASYHPPASQAAGQRYCQQHSIGEEGGALMHAGSSGRSSLASSHGGSCGEPHQAMPLQTASTAVREKENGAVPPLPSMLAEHSVSGGWGAGYEKAFLGEGASPDRSSQLEVGGPLSGRWRVSTQDENGSRGGRRLPSFNVDRYERFDG